MPGRFSYFFVVLRGIVSDPGPHRSANSSLFFNVVDPDPHQIERQDLDPDQHQGDSWIWIRIRTKVICWIRIRIQIRINLQMAIQNVWKMSIFEHFFKVLSLIWKLGSGSAQSERQDPDPHQSAKTDPDQDPQQSDKQDQDPDPHQSDADPQQCCFSQICGYRRTYVIPIGSTLR